MRFAAMVSEAPSGHDWMAQARRLEESGYSSLAMPDQLYGDAWSSMPALTAAALATSRLRVGNHVLNNNLYNPVSLARAATTIDVISGGRYELGLGAGWSPKDYESSGIGQERGRVRVARLAEAVRLLKRLFTEAEVTWQGCYYRAERAECKPEPFQKPHPPILIAGGGPELLAIAGAEADIAGIGLYGIGRNPITAEVVSMEGVRRQVDVVRQAAGDRFKGLEMSTFINVVLTDNREMKIAEMVAAGANEEVTRSSVFLAIGNLTEIGDHMVRVRDELGITYFCLLGAFLEELGPLIRDLSASA